MSIVSNSTIQLPSTPEEVVQRTLELVENNDFEGGQALFSALRDDESTRVYKSQFAALRDDESIREQKSKVDVFVHTLMFNDHAAMAQCCLSQHHINNWMSRFELDSEGRNQSNLTHFLHHCSSMVGSWLRTLDSQKLSTIYQQNFNRQQKEEAVAGQSSIAALRFMVAVLKIKPALWNLLDFTWLGEENSSTRRKAMDIGWCKEMVPAMIAQQVKNSDVHNSLSIGAWSTVVQYPYSLYLLQTRLKIAPTNKKAGDVFQFHACTNVLQQITNDNNANPMDAALASILVTKAPRKQNGNTLRKFRTHPDVPTISESEMSILLGLVDTYIALDDLTGLQEFVLYEGLEKMQSMRTNESFDIPDLGSP